MTKQPEDAKIPVKNTFIHYECAEGEGPPAKIRRTSSAPELSGGPEGTAAAPPQVSGGGTCPKGAEAAERPAKKVSIAEPEPQSGVEKSHARAERGGVKRSRSRDHRSSVSRSRPRSEASQGSRGSAPRELEEEERHGKRAKYISDMKETEGYRILKQKQRSGDATARAAPGTPDPDDRDIGKRKWEKQIMEWRQALNEYGPASVAKDAA
jgi:hypothetical protein